MPLRFARCVVATCLMAVALVAAGHAYVAHLSMQDCVEGSDFVANAARARDNGMSREAFIERLEADLAAIRSLPPALRWYVRGEDDERLLRESVRRVYERPLPPERHRNAFLVHCLDHVDVGATTKSEEVNLGTGALAKPTRTCDPSDCRAKPLARGHANAILTANRF